MHGAPIRKLSPTRNRTEKATHARSRLSSGHHGKFGTSRSSPEKAANPIKQKKSQENLFSYLFTLAFPLPKADEKGKLKERELLTDGRVLVTEVVMVLLMTGPPPTPALGFAGTCGNLRFLKDKATGFWVIGKGVFGRGIARGF